MSGFPAALVVASTRTQVGDFLEALIQVYFIMIIAYILLSLVQSAGVRIPYNRASSAVIGFLNDAVEPYLAFFRRFLPPLGPFDLSPLVGIIVLQVVGNVVVSLVKG
jgi:YggT family protein